MGQSGDRIHEQDRVVWVGDDTVRGIGSSGKAYEIDGDRVLVGWGGGNDGWYDIGREIVSCQEAGRRGIEPWASAFREDQ